MFTAYAERLLTESGTPGAAVWLARDGKVERAAGLGQRDREAGLPATPDTVFGTGSLTKSVTCLAVLLLAEEGRLSPDDPITRFLPELRLPGDAQTGVTLHHLMSHTAGLPSLPGRWFAAQAGGLLEEVEQAEVARLLEGLPPHPPIADYDGIAAFLGAYPYVMHGPRFSYSNEGYALLGAVIERLSGEPYARFVTRRILAPLGMTRSTFALTDLAAWDDVTAVYVRRSGAVVRSPSWFHAPAILPTGQLRSTVRDLGRYYEMLRGGGVLAGVRIAQPATIAAMTAAHATVDADRAYGYGLMSGRFPGGGLGVSHGGAHKGVQAMAGYLPEAGLTCVVLTNLQEGPAARLWTGALNVALGRPPEAAPPPPPAINLASAPALTGTFRSGEGTRLAIRADAAGALTVETAGQTFPARAIAPDTLAFGEEQTIRLVPDETGAVRWAFFGLRLIPREQG